MLYLNFYNNSPGGCYFIKVENLRFCMGKGCARGGAVREVAQTSRAKRFLGMPEPQRPSIKRDTPH